MPYLHRRSERDARRLQVRVGLGVMPAFSAEEIDEEELDALVAYLDALRGR